MSVENSETLTDALLRDKLNKDNLNVSHCFQKGQYNNVQLCSNHDNIACQTNRTKFWSSLQRFRTDVLQGLPS